MLPRLQMAVLTNSGAFPQPLTGWQPESEPVAAPVRVELEERSLLEAHSELDSVKLRPDIATSLSLEGLSQKLPADLQRRPRSSQKASESLGRAGYVGSPPWREPPVTSCRSDHVPSGRTGSMLLVETSTGARSPSGHRVLWPSPEPQDACEPFWRSRSSCSTPAKAQISRPDKCADQRCPLLRSPEAPRKGLGVLRQSSDPRYYRGMQARLLDERAQAPGGGTHPRFQVLPTQSRSAPTSARAGTGSAMRAWLVPERSGSIGRLWPPD